MAEITPQEAQATKEFQETIKKIITDASKRPSAPRAGQAIAVQIVDKTGKIEAGKTGSVEQEREKLGREKKRLSLLEKIAAGMSADMLKEKAEKKIGGVAGFLKSILPGLLPAGAIAMLGGASLLSKLGIGAIALGGVVAAVSAINDGLKGMDWAEETGQKGGKTTGFISGFIAGDLKGGMTNAFRKGAEGALLGATAGLATGNPILMVVGAILGAALFGIAGWFGREKVGKLIGPVIEEAQKLFGVAITVTPEELEKSKELAKASQTAAEQAFDDLEEVINNLKKAREAAIPDLELIDKLIVEEFKLRKALVKAEKKRKEDLSTHLVNERQLERSELIDAEAALIKNSREWKDLVAEKKRVNSKVMHFKDIENDEDKLELAALKAEQAKLKMMKVRNREERKKLRVVEKKAEEKLLAEDIRLVKEGEEGGAPAGWRSQWNVYRKVTLPAIRENIFKFLMVGAPKWVEKQITDSKELAEKSWASTVDLSVLIGKSVASIWRTIKNVFWHTDGKSGLFQQAEKKISDSLEKMAKRLGDVDFSMGLDFSKTFKDMEEIFSTDRILGAIGRKLEKQDWTFPGDFLGFGEGIKKLLLLIFDPSLGPFSQAFSTADTTSALAKGGAFQKGTPILVGELGPEVIMPSGSGTVIPNNKLGGGDERIFIILKAIHAELMSGTGGTAINAPTTNVATAPTTIITEPGAARQRIVVNG